LRLSPARTPSTPRLLVIGGGAWFGESGKTIIAADDARKTAPDGESQDEAKVRESVIFRPKLRQRLESALADFTGQAPDHGAAEVAKLAASRAGREALAEGIAALRTRWPAPTRRGARCSGPRRLRWPRVAPARPADVLCARRAYLPRRGRILLQLTPVRVALSANLEEP